MSLEELREAVQRAGERAIEALRDFIDRALPPEPALRPIPVTTPRRMPRRTARY